jgi:histidyl-tRNA synthetase
LRTTWEFVPPTEGAQSTIGGGGRYDGLIQELGGPPTPGIGFATGIERIILNLKRLGVEPPPKPRPEVFLVVAAEKARSTAANIARNLRQAGIGVWTGVPERSLKSQLRQANTRGARYAVILGEREIAEHTATLRTMETSGQEVLGQDALLDRLTNGL